MVLEDLPQFVSPQRESEDTEIHEINSFYLFILVWGPHQETLKANSWLCALVP